MRPVAAVIAALALCAILSTSRPAEAVTADCIPAARFASLARIADGSYVQLAELLGLPGQTPPQDGCRAVLLSGQIEKGSAAVLLAAIIRNKGWLSQVYIAVSDGDLDEEVALAQLMRDFALTGVMVDGGGFYTPLITALPRNLPSSVSYSWQNADRLVRTRFSAAFNDYLENTDRKVQPAAVACGAGCWTLLAGAIERYILQPIAARPQDAPGSVQTPDDARLRDSVRAGFGPNFQLIKDKIGYRSSLPVPRFADFDRKAIDTDCRPAVDYADVLEAEIAQATNNMAAKNFPYMPLAVLLPKIRRLQDASGNAELCMRKGVSRLRASIFADQCKDACAAKLSAVEASADATLRRYAAAPPK